MNSFKHVITNNHQNLLIRATILTCFLLLNTYSFGQGQKVDYSITCKLDDVRHRLTADMEILYHNNSSDTLPFLKLHAWMNAFQSNKSEYTKQLKKIGDDRKFKLSKIDQGGYDTLSFFNSNKSLQFTFDNPSAEIINLQLEKPLGPHDSIRIGCHYVLDIPKNISRGGHLGQSYQMTQWYPKVAVYDSLGWNTMSYLELGEYYNDFGDYEVNIILPESYVVAATGELQTANEISFLHEKANKNQDSIEANNMQQRLGLVSPFKKISYKESLVHDFAWFADKNFIVHHDTLRLENKIIDIWSFYHKKKNTSWRSATLFSKRALEYLNNKIAIYPYGQISIVECDRPGSDGMEYPMITLIDGGYAQSPLELEKVIVHEIAHNWFQGVLASNERKEAWLDEGLVSYYEKDYFKERNIPTFLSEAPLPFITDYDKVIDFPWYLQASFNKDIAPSSSIKNFSLMGYVQSIYEKPSKGLKLVNKTLGDVEFDELIKVYFNDNKFSHVQGSDFIRSLRSKNIQWYDSLYILSNQKIDLKIKANNNYLIFNHNLKYPIPVEIEGYKKGKPVWNKLVNSVDSLYFLEIDRNAQDYILADPNFLLPEIVRTNNVVRYTKSPFNPKKYSIQMIPGLGQSTVKERYLHPIIGFNTNDGFYPGILLHNISLPASNTLAGILLGYGFKSKKIVTQSGIEIHTTSSNKAIDRLGFGLEFKSFGSEGKWGIYDQSSYFKIAPKFLIHFKNKSQVSPERQFHFRPIFISKKLRYAPNSVSSSKYDWSNYSIYEFGYQDQNAKHLFPHHWHTTIDLSKKYFNLNSTFNIKLPFKYGKNTFTELKLFGGIQSSKTMHFNSNFTLSGSNRDYSDNLDYKYDELLLGRASSEQRISQQIFLKDAGLFTLSQAGENNHWLIATSLRFKLIDYLPLRPYIQMALAPNKYSESQTGFYFTSGVSFIILKDMLEVNLPLYENENLKRGYTFYHKEKYVQRVNFLFNMKNLNPMKWISSLGR